MVYVSSHFWLWSVCLFVRNLSAAHVSLRRTPRSTHERATLRAKVNVGTRAEEVMKLHTLSVLQRCPAEGPVKREEMHTSPCSWTVYLSRGEPHTLANTSRTRHQSVCIWLHAAPKKRRISDRKEHAAHRSQETPVRQTPDGARNQESMASCRSEGTAEWVAARREWNERLYVETIVPWGEETKSEQQIAKKVSVLLLLKLKSVISALAFLGQTFSRSREHMEATGGSTLLSRLVFRQERMAIHYSEELQRTTAGCRNSHLKSAPTDHCHTSDREIRFRGGKTRTLASHSWAVLFQQVEHAY